MIDTTGSHTDAVKMMHNLLLLKILEQSLSLHNGLYRLGKLHRDTTQQGIAQDNEVRHLRESEMMGAQGEVLRTQAMFKEIPRAMAPSLLKACLLRTFEQLGIKGRVVEVKSGAWLPNTTLDAIMDWVNNRVTKTNQRDELAVRDFVQTFDDVARAQVLDQGRPR